MRLAEAAERPFARHETFHPRYSWFRKAYSHVDDNPRIFSRPDAPVEIGVGKNMVRAIRFWGREPAGTGPLRMTRTLGPSGAGARWPRPNWDRRSSSWTLDHRRGQRIQQTG